MKFRTCVITIIIVSNIYVPFILCKEFTPVVIRVCQKSISLNKTVIPKLIEIPWGSRVLLICNYCGSNQNEFGAKLWYYQKRGKQFKKQEIIPEMKNDIKKSRIYMTPAHTLIVNNFHKHDSGIYSCQNLNNEIVSLEFIFILDVGCFLNTRSITGTKTKWVRFKRQKLDPINNLRNYSKDTLSFKLNRIYTITYCWDDWQPCALYGQKTYRKRLGKCCLRPKVNETVYDLPSENFIDEFDILCRSLVLNDTYPDISLLVRNLPDFNFFELCHIDTLFPKRNTVRLPRATTNKIKSIVRKIPEYGHLALTCNVFPWSSNIKWYKNNKLLNDTFRKNMDADEDPHLFIDTFNTLYILHATKYEHGTYTCTSNGVSMQKIDVKVISSSKLLNQDFFRYSIYLAFVLSLTVTCYCAGICVAWHQRASFADPLDLNSTKKKTSGV